MVETKQPGDQRKIRLGILVIAFFFALACPFRTNFASGDPDYSAEAKVIILPKSYSADELTTKEDIPWWEKVWIVKKGRRLLR